MSNRGNGNQLIGHKDVHPKYLDRYGNNHDMDKFLTELLTPIESTVVQLLNNDIFKNMDIATKGSYPRTDIINFPDKMIIECAIPGMQKEDITIEVNDNCLSISGKSSQQEHKDGQYIFRELKRSSFRRTWELPEYLNLESITAKFDNGILSLEIKKKVPEELLNKTRKIEIG